MAVLRMLNFSGVFSFGLFFSVEIINQPLPFQERACEHVKDSTTTAFFASPQCIPTGSKRKLSYEMCFPPKKEVLKKVKKIVKKTKAKRVFVATDNDPMIKELNEALKSLKVFIRLV